MKTSIFLPVLCCMAALYIQPGISDDSESNESGDQTTYCRKIQKRCPGSLPTGRVCGSDGKTYKDTCNLQRAGCKSSSRITVAYPGPCKPTTGDGSKMSKQCQRVIRRCPRKLRRGECCGTDDVTYPNECELHRTRCRAGKTMRQLRVAHIGPCQIQIPTQPPATTSAPLPPPTTQLTPCHRHCGAENSGFVCGSDGVTYLSACHLEKIACLTRTTITALYPGLCRPAMKPADRPPSRPSKPHAPAGPKHEETTVFATPEVPTTHPLTAKTPTTIAPTTIRPITKAPTEVATTVAPTHIATEKPKCVMNGVDIRVLCDDGTVITDPPPCPTSCDVTIDTKPVCGSDGKTYKTKCHLHMEACLAENFRLTVEYVGECVEDTGPGTDCDFCPGIVYAPVCGTDSISYYNECELRKYACYINDPTLQVVHGGVCRDLPPPPVTPDCPNRCPLTIDPVCGTNGKTYKSICLLKSAACELNDPTLTVAYIGNCILPTTQDPCVKECSTQYDPVCGSDWTTYLNGCFFSIASCRDPRLHLLHPGTCTLTVIRSHAQW